MVSGRFTVHDLREDVSATGQAEGPFPAGGEYLEHHGIEQKQRKQEAEVQNIVTLSGGWAYSYRTYDRWFSECGMALAVRRGSRGQWARQAVRCSVHSNAEIRHHRLQGSKSVPCDPGFSLIDSVRWSILPSPEFSSRKDVLLSFKGVAE